MSPVQLLHHEVRGFLYGLTALLGYRALTGRLALSGLLASPVDGTAVGPERIQLLLATLAVSAMYVREVVHGGGTAMPDVSNLTLLVFGGSGGVYAVVKAFRFRTLSPTFLKENVP